MQGGMGQPPMNGQQPPVQPDMGGMPQQGMMGQEMGQQPEMSGNEIKAQIQQMVAQMPQEQLLNIAKMNPEEAIQMIMEKPSPPDNTSLLDDIGDEQLALEIAGLVYEEIMNTVQQSTNQTLGMINPGIMQGGEQQGQQMPSPGQQSFFQGG